MITPHFIGKFYHAQTRHIPLSRASPWPQGGDLPKKYYDVMDPFVVLGAVAAVTTRLKIATGICLVPQRDPIQTATENKSLPSYQAGGLSRRTTLPSMPGAAG